MLYQDHLAQNEPTALYSLDDPTAQAIFEDPSTARLERIFSELGLSSLRDIPEPLKQLSLSDKQPVR
jgi:hypothetical protein